jgi:biopolymer transport protein ExbD
MPEAGERGGGNRSVNVVAIVAIVILVLLAVFALANRKPSDQARKTTESSTKATPSKDSDIDIKVDVPDSVTISTD